MTFLLYLQQDSAGDEICRRVFKDVVMHADHPLRHFLLSASRSEPEVELSCNHQEQRLPALRILFCDFLLNLPFVLVMSVFFHVYFLCWHCLYETNSLKIRCDVFFVTTILFAVVDFLFSLLCHCDLRWIKKFFLLSF